MKSSKILAIILLISVGAVLAIIGFVLLTRPKAINPPPKPEVNKIEISADKKSILNAETNEVIFTIADTQRYLKNTGYFYDPDTFQDTNAKYTGNCFTDTALSNNKDRMVFSTGCLLGDLPQPWIGVYKPRDYCKTGTDGKIRCLDIVPLSPIKFLIGGSGRNFVWSADDKTITYEADIGLSGMTETRTINSQTGEILIDTSDWKIYRNEKYGFEFQYPGIYDEKEEYKSCRLREDSLENVNPLLFISVASRVWLQILDPNGLTFSEYVDKIINKDLELESKKTTSVGGKEAVSLTYRLLGSGAYGLMTLLEKDKKIYMFSLERPVSECFEIENISVFTVYGRMLSTFRFIE